MAAVVTGLGVVSPFGLGVEAYLRGRREGRSAARRIALFDPVVLPCQVAAEVPSFDAAAPLDPEDLHRVGRIVPLSIAAAREALMDAGLGGDLPLEVRRNIGVVIGSGAGAIDFAERQYEAYYREGIRRVNPFAISSSVVGMVSSELSIRFGFSGPSHVLSNGCTSSTDALGYALHAIDRREQTIVLTGGAEACITPGMMQGVCRMRAAAARRDDRPGEASRPFTIHPRRLVLG